MGISVETLALAKKHATRVAEANAQAAMEQAIVDAVAQSKIYTDKAIGEITHFSVEIVKFLPTVDINPHTIYFVPMSTAIAADSYYEYMYIDGAWELIGTTQIDLSDYYTKAEVQELIENGKFVLPTASTTTIGGVKIDDVSIKINSDGVIFVNKEVTESTAQEVVDKNFTIISSDDILLLF